MIKVIKYVFRFIRTESEAWGNYLGSFLIEFLPASPICNCIKKYVLVFRGAKIGTNVYIYPGVYIDKPNRLVIGDDVVLSRDVIITTSGGVCIGDRVMVGYGSKILSADHAIPQSVEKPIRFSGHVFGPVNIQDDVWICANCVITQGITVGRSSVIAAGAVVIKDVPPHIITGGVPAKIIKSRIG